MRVGFDARWYNSSGVGRYVAGLLPALARAGVEMVVYYDATNPVPGLDLLALQTVPVRAGRYSPFASLEFRRREREDKLDLLHCPFYAAPSLRCPLVVTVHDLIPFLFPIYPWLKQRMVQAGYRTMARRAAHIIADSRQTASDVQKILGVSCERISTVHLAADREMFHPHGVATEYEMLEKKFKVKKPYVLVASAPNWRTKNLKGALEALRIARGHEGVEFQTLVYGSSSALEAQNVEQFSRDLPLIRAGHVETQDLAALFRNAQAFVMPSFYEGFGLPLVEAMACGCPVITSDRGSLPEVAGPGAQCFDPLDTQGMAVALVELLLNPNELQSRAVLALKRADDFSWDKAAEETIRVYHLVNRLISTQ